MRFMLCYLVLCYIALASPAPDILHPGGIGGIFKGPNSETIVKGPDGSIITSAAEGGEVHTGLEPIIVAEPAPIAVEAPALGPVAVETHDIGPVAVETSVVVDDTPAVATPLAHPIEAVAVPPSPVESDQSSDLIGPSGRISTQGSKAIVAGPSSTTIAGPAVVAQTIVRGPPILAAAPIAPLPAAPIEVSAAPLAVSAAPIGQVSVTPLPELSPISVTASPISAVTRAELGHSIQSASFAAAPRHLPLEVGRGAIAPGHLGPALRTDNIGISSPLPVVSSTLSPLSLGGRVQTVDSQHVLGINNQGAPFAPGLGTGSLGLSSVTASPLPVGSSTLSPLSVTGRIQANHGLLGVNDQADLRGAQLLPDQLAIDDRQLRLNPALIPSNNIIPPEIGLSSRGIGRRPELLTTPGLGAIGSSTIRQEEYDGALAVTPQAGLRGNLSPDQVIALQNQQDLINNQIQTAPQALDPRLISTHRQTINITPRNDLLLQNGDPRLDGRTTLGNVQQQEILSSELARSGIDASQLQLTNVPLSDVSPLPRNPQNIQGGIGDPSLTQGGWARYGRETGAKKD